MAVTTTNIIRYSVLPGIWPRFKELFGSGFSFLASILAVLYFNLGLLPAGHPYLNHNNYGRFGLRHVIAAAGKNLVFSRKHIDQIILYFVILIGLVILALQIVLLVMSLFASPVFAGPVTWADATFTYSWSSYFVDTPHGPLQDLAFIVLDQIFGVMLESGSTTGTTGFFESCYSNTGVDCTDIRGNIVFSPTTFPAPMHFALHQMLVFYTLGIGYLAGAVILYFIVTIVGETVTTGTPFGQRFNKAWFIPRLIMFFALLAPITFTGNNSGINVAQLITFAVAKFGSNMATNAWLGFIDQGIAVTASTNYSDFIGQGRSMLAVPNIPELGTLAQYMYVVRTCMYAQKIMKGIDVVPYIVRAPSNNSSNVTLRDGTTTVPYNTMGMGADNYLQYHSGFFGAYIPFAQAVQFSRYQDVVLRFGHRNPPGGSVFAYDRNDPPDAYDDEWGHVEPTCGELKFEITSFDPFVIGPPPAGYGTMSVQGTYWSTIEHFLNWDNTFREVPYCMLKAILPYDVDHSCINTPLPFDPGVMGVNINGTIAPANVPLGADNVSQSLTVDNARVSMELINVINKARMTGQYLDWNNAGPVGSATGTSIHENFENAKDDGVYDNNLIMPIEIRERGWVGASLWYNKLAEINGTYASAVQNVPRPFKYPKIMEKIAEQHLAHDNNNTFTGRFNPRLANGNLADLPEAEDQIIAASLYHVYEFWNESSTQETVLTRKSSNIIIDAINMILGTSGIFDILENKGVYPLAMLSGLGKSMVDAALRNLFAGIVGQGIGEIMDGFIGGMSKVASSFAFRFGMIGIGIGFILYYVLPLLPFIYFFFAFSGWIKSIFEAMLAMPLWALAHIKIDGNGLSGPWASNGYFLLFEIFLRPILIIFGFIFSISVFAALVDGVHDSYHLLTYVVSGYDIEAEMNSNAYPALRDITNFTSTEGMSFMRGPIDEMFYTIIYVIIVYMIGLSCFKLVDTIPNNIMRWMGVTVSTIQENAGDPAGQLTSKLFRGTQITNMQIMGMISKAQGLGGHDPTAAHLMMMK